MDSLAIKNIFDKTLISSGHIKITVYSFIEVFLIIVITWLVVWALKKFLLKSGKVSKVDHSFRYTLFTVIKYTLWVIAISMILQSIGVKITILIASSAALLVGVGMGLQQIFKDIISGIFLLFEGVIKVDDIVELAGFVGRVQEIGIRTTKILTRDNIVMIIPNSKFIEENVINWSTMDELSRFSVSVGVAYGSDVQKVEEALLSCAQEHPRISKTMKPKVRFEDFGDSSLNFQLYFYTEHGFRVEWIKSDLRHCIDRKFREAGIEIPFPQRDVYIKHPLK